MPYKKKFAARRIQRAWRRKKYRHKRYRTPSRATGFLKCIQKFSRTEPIPSSGAGSFNAFQEVYALDQVATANLTAFQRLFKWWKISKIVHVLFHVILVTREPRLANLCLNYLLVVTL